ncbi:MAG: TfoX/Sxy family protein, partial [Blastocatellia bacterium]
MPNSFSKLRRASKSGQTDREAKMAFSEKLADRIRQTLGEEPGVIEKKMFGGLAFMVNGNMSCGVVGEDLMVRV